MNRDNSETAEMLRKLMVACLTGLEADHVTRANLIIDAGVRRGCRKKKHKFNQPVAGLIN